MKGNYPLLWPPAIPRTKRPRRSRFGKDRFPSLERAGRGLSRELRLLGARDVVLSTNMELRLDGLPRSNQRRPDDEGVAVYFELDGSTHCMAVDRWDLVGCNAHAIALCVGALRGLDRWGSPQMVKASFTGFRALPALGESSGETWWSVLAIGDPTATTREEVDRKFKGLARIYHPDLETHDAAKWAAITAARTQGLNATN